jgi:hypothetical protein
MGDYGMQPPGTVNVGVDYGRAMEKLNLPAIFMMVIAGISIAFSLLGLVLNLLGTSMGSLLPSSAGADERVVNMFSGIFGIIFNLIAVGINGFVIFGAMKMKKLENYTLSMIAAIVNGLPCSGCCCGFGLAVSIWALIVLFDNSVKAAFRS